MFRPSSGPGGGLSPVDNQMYRPGEALVYVGTDDIEATLARAEELGAKTLMPKTEIPHTGWFAILSDPSGARVALYQNMQPSE
jgi:predicted enzyme related to lactoylglutathione lyase